GQVISHDILAAASVEDDLVDGGIDRDIGLDAVHPDGDRVGPAAAGVPDLNVVRLLVAGDGQHAASFSDGDAGKGPPVEGLEPQDGPHGSQTISHDKSS